MPRLRQVPRAEVTSDFVLAMYDYLFGQRDPVAEPGTAEGTPGDWWTVMALSPEIMEHAVGGFLLYQSPARSLDPVLRELAQCRCGFDAGSQFVYSQHCHALEALGVGSDKVAGVSVGPSASCFDQTERLVLAYVDALVFDRGRVSDQLFDGLLEELGDVAMLELTYITTLYLQHAVMSRALRVEFDDRPEAVVMVPKAEP